MHLRVLAGHDGSDGVRLASVITEGCLKELLGIAPEARAQLGDLIRRVRGDEAAFARVGTERLKDINWLNARRNEAVHFKGGGGSLRIDDAHDAAETVIALIRALGLLSDDELDAVRREASRAASAPASEAVLKLDRAPQRTELDDLLGVGSAVSVATIDGEVGQGHDHFARVILWRMRTGPKGQWRQLDVDWPAPSDAAGLRLAMLIATLVAEVGGDPRKLPPGDPTDDASRAAWDAALAGLHERLTAGRRRLWARHRIPWPHATDATLAAEYVRRVWEPAAEQATDRLVVTFEVARAERVGLPWLSRAWRRSRAERVAAGALVGAIQTGPWRADVRAEALPELGSVEVEDLARWLRHETRRSREDAERDAAQLIELTRGGRFDTVVKRIATLQPRARP